MTGSDGRQPSQAAAHSYSLVASIVALFCAGTVAIGALALIGWITLALPGISLSPPPFAQSSTRAAAGYGGYGGIIISLHHVPARAPLPALPFGDGEAAVFSPHLVAILRLCCDYGFSVPLQAAHCVVSVLPQISCSSEGTAFLIRAFPAAVQISAGKN